MIKNARANTRTVREFVHTVEVTRTGPELSVNEMSVAEFSVAELSERSGVPVSAIRMYQQRKLLQPPERRGRNGFYGQAHLDRLVFIGRLQAKGYSLAAILDVIQNPSGGMERIIDDAVPIMADRAVTMTLAQLIQQLPAADFSIESLQRTHALGLLEINGAEVTVREPAFLEAGRALSGLSIPTDAILDAYEALQVNVDQIANEFAKVFDTYTDTGRELQAGTLSDDVLDNATKQLEQLTRTAVEVVAAELRHALRGIAAQRLAKLSVPDQHSHRPA
jgi:DNA-binding transcriptional MerR regulator